MSCRGEKLSASAYPFGDQYPNHQPKTGDAANFGLFKNNCRFASKSPRGRSQLTSTRRGVHPQALFRIPRSRARPMEERRRSQVSCQTSSPLSTKSQPARPLRHESLHLADILIAPTTSPPSGASTNRSKRSAPPHSTKPSGETCPLPLSYPKTVVLIHWGRGVPGQGPNYGQAVDYIKNYLDHGHLTDNMGISYQLHAV